MGGRWGALCAWVLRPFWWHCWGCVGPLVLWCQVRQQSGGRVSSPQALKDAVTDLPLGFAGSALAAPRCPLTDLEFKENDTHAVFDCPADTRVGNVTLLTDLPGNGPSSSVAEAEFPSALYNMVPERGHPVEFAFLIHGAFAVHLVANIVHTPAGYALRIVSPDSPSFFARSGRITGGTLDGVTLTLFGDPEAEDGGAGGASLGNLPVPAFTNPTDCSGAPLAATVHIDTWQNVGRSMADGEPDFSDPNWLEAKSMLPATTGCELLSFNPSFTAAPETTVADSPTGLTTHLAIPQAPDNDFSLTTADLESATVALPAGLTHSDVG
jgi:hypothetical protein